MSDPHPTGSDRQPRRGPARRYLEATGVLGGIAVTHARVPLRGWAALARCSDDPIRMESDWRASCVQ